VVSAHPIRPGGVEGEMSAALPHPFVRPDRSGAVPLLSPRSLDGLRAGPEPPLLLDVRPSRERALARLPEDRHIPLAELPGRLAELPKRRGIVVYDQYGSNARRAADFLQKAGFPEAGALEGGIDEYARLVDPSVGRYRSDASEGSLVVRQLPRPSTGCLAYLVADASERTAVLIDPGHEVEPYLAALREENWSLRAIVETHTHADHIAGHAELHRRTDAPIFVSERSPAQYPHRVLADGAAVNLGGEEIVALATPGHTPDHVTLHLRDKVFTGDTLLIGACGRTDLGGGSPDELWESLHERVLALPNETEVFPAHYGAHHALVDRYVSNLGFERATNEALLQPTREAFVRYMTEGWPPKPKDFDAICAANLAPFS
jgi:sulfur dioxygenase